jgi:8-oxo-dGTP pyrophosphatase MutT (NUDIX family)
LELLNKVKALHGRQVHILGHEHSFKAAVLLPLRKQGDTIEILFEKRAAHLKKQPGDVCFPGGRVEEGDQHPAQTAVRETCEELGIAPDQVQLIAPLDVLVTNYHGHIYPYVGLIDHEARLNPNYEEVEKIFAVPLTFFLETEPERYDVTLAVQPPEDFPFERIVMGRKYRFRKSTIPEYFFTYQNDVIWGMTARILVHFVQLIKELNNNEG